MELSADILHQSHNAPAGDIALPRISVIVPVRNDQKRLALCLKALSTSKLTEFEIIVVDDASTDDSAKVAESFGASVLRLPKQSGPAAARNLAGESAQGPILMFIDADVCVHPDTLSVAAATLEDPTIDAVFGSYDLQPAEPNLLSQFKNLAHRYFHQVAGETATTFWTGCGAIRRDVFKKFEFDAKRFPHPSIEDIDLGARIARAGHKIVINKQMQATHLKKWTLSGIIRSDLLDRAIPWTELILRQEKLPGELNLSAGQRIAALLTALSSFLFIIACLFHPLLVIWPILIFGGIEVADRITATSRGNPILKAVAATAMLFIPLGFVLSAKWWSVAILLPLCIVIGINARYYRYFIKHRGPLFSAVLLPMQIAYYLYSLVGFVVGHLLHYSRQIQSIDERRVRIRLYVCVACFLYAVAWTLVLVRAHVKQTTIDFAVSDAMGYYAYLPSLVIDHDLQFDNQLAAQFAVPDADDVKQMKHNRWPIGVAISIAPAFLSAHAIVLALHRLTGSALCAPNGYTPIYFVFCVAWIMGIGTLGMIILDRLLVERLQVSGRIAAAAVLMTWLGTHYAWYFTREPLLTHMVGASWIIFAVFLIHRLARDTASQQLVWWHLPLLAFATSMALACRWTSGFILPMFAYLALVLVRNGFLWRSLKMAPLILLAISPLLIQLLITRILNGHAIAGSVQGLGYRKEEGFFWTQPALLRSLFSSRHGLFFSTPTLLMAAWGIIWHFWKQGRRSDPFLVFLALSALLLWYVNSAWYAWWFGPSVGNRGYVELAVLYGIGFALSFVWLSTQSMRAKRIVLGALLGGVLINFTLAGFKLTDLIEDNQTLIPLEDWILTGRWSRI